MKVLDSIYFIPNGLNCKDVRSQLKCEFYVNIFAEQFPRLETQPLIFVLLLLPVYWLLQFAASSAKKDILPLNGFVNHIYCWVSAVWERYTQRPPARISLEKMG